MRSISALRNASTPFGRSPALGDSPDDQRLTSSHIARGENRGNRGHVIGIGRHVAARIQGHTKLVEHSIADRSGESHCQQYKIRLDRKLGSGQRLELGWRPHAGCVQQLHAPGLVAGKFRGCDSPVANPAFLMRAFRAQLQRPQRPGSAWRARIRRLGKQLKLQHRTRLLTMRGADAIGPGVASPDYHYTLAAGRYILCFGERQAIATPILRASENRAQNECP